MAYTGHGVEKMGLCAGRNGGHNYVRHQLKKVTRLNVMFKVGDYKDLNVLNAGVLVNEV
jgi:hypothetical protein